ncbi:MAG TPA: hypothetical protein DEH78_25955 [Solibacterales bacterium]|nr:hypothetical protein [Bryobacterales bacterium]
MGQLLDQYLRFSPVRIDGVARVLTVVNTWRGDCIRIISARLATPRERRQYLENT